MDDEAKSATPGGGSVGVILGLLSPTLAWLRPSPPKPVFQASTTPLYLGLASGLEIGCRKEPRADLPDEGKMVGNIGT